MAGPAGISPYVSYAESFEPVVGIDTITNQQLLPQEGRQYEAGIKWQPTGINALVTLSAFDIEVSNLPNPNALVGGNSQQEGISKVRGIEFEGNALVGGLRLDAKSAISIRRIRTVSLTSIADWGLAVRPVQFPGRARRAQPGWRALRRWEREQRRLGDRWQPSDLPG